MHSTCLLLLQGEAVEVMEEEPESELEKVEPPAPQSERELQVLPAQYTLCAPKLTLTAAGAARA
jgi:hypothetical protein